MTLQEIETALTNDEQWLSTMAYVHRGKDVQQGIKEALGHLVADDERLSKSTMTDWKKLVNSWLSTKRFPRENVVRVKRDISKL